MVKGRGRGRDGRELVILGLSEANFEKLLEGWPILVRTREDMGVEGGPDVLIMGGRTEEVIAEELRKWMGRAAGSGPREG